MPIEKKKHTFRQWIKGKGTLLGLCIALIGVIVNIVIPLFNTPMWKQLEYFYGQHKKLIEVEDLNETSAQADLIAINLHDAIKLCNHVYSKKKLFINYCESLPSSMKIRMMNEADFSRFANQFDLYCKVDMTASKSFADNSLPIIRSILKNQTRYSDYDSGELELRMILGMEKKLTLLQTKHSDKLMDILSKTKEIPDKSDLKKRKKIMIKLCKYFKSKKYLQYQVAFQEYLESYATVCEIEYNKIIYR